MADTSESSRAGGCLEKLLSFLFTQKGVILATEILLSFIIIICYAVSLYRGNSAVAICELVFAAFFFVIFMMELDKQILQVAWVWSDLLRAVIGSAVYIVTSFTCLIKWHGDGAHFTGNMLGMGTGFLLAYDTYTIARKIHSTREHTAASTGR